MVQYSGLQVWIMILRGGMNDNSDLDDNQKLLVEAFKLQNEQAYDEAFEKLQGAGENLIRIIEKIQANTEFHMRHMQLMKEERDLVGEKDYKEFLAKNDKILSRNFEKNAYLALLMQEIEDRETPPHPKKWTTKEEQLLRKLIKEGVAPQELQGKFHRHRKEEVLRRYEQLKLPAVVENDDPLLESN